MTLVTAGESHGPALVAIVSGLPAGLVLHKDAIDADLHRRQQGYGRSTRQQIEQDQVEVLAGLRQGRTLGTPLIALLVQAQSGASLREKERRRSRSPGRDTPTSPACSSTACPTSVTHSNGRVRVTPP